MAEKQTELERTLAASLAALKGINKHAPPPPQRVIPVPRTGHVPQTAPASTRAVRTAVAEGRSLQPLPPPASFTRGGRLVERVVVTRAQLIEHENDGYEALFAWEQAQRALGRTVLFWDDLAKERVVFESIEHSEDE